MRKNRSPQPPADLRRAATAICAERGLSFTGSPSRQVQRLATSFAISLVCLLPSSIAPLLVAAPAAAASRPTAPAERAFPCVGTFYEVDDPPLLPGGSTALPEIVALGDGNASLSNGCAQGRVLARRIGRDTFAVRGVWRHCEGRTGKVGFWVRVGEDCEQLVGRVGMSEPRAIHVFEAKRIPSCQQASDCGKGSYCRRLNGACSARGACVAKPDACIAIHDPVCGCDGTTHASACAAAAAAVSVAHRGACELACSATVGPGCPVGETCTSSTAACALATP